MAHARSVVTARAATQPPETVAERVRLALQVLELGAWVFPLAANSKKPLIPKNKGGGGFLDAKPDTEMARTFLENPGQPNYGVVFPEGSDVIVLDLDGGEGDTRPNWREDWQRLYDRYGPPGLTYIVRTPSDGRHAYYRWRADLYGALPPGDELLGWTVRKPWKGYLVGPGSIVNGRTYELAGADRIADLPEAWSLAAVEEARGRIRTPSQRTTLTIKGPGSVKIGHRHAYLRDQARHLVGVGLTGDALLAAVLDLNRQLQEPKDRDDVIRAIGEAESRFEPDDVEQDGTIRRTTSRIYAEDVELAMPAIQPFPQEPDAVAFAGLAGEAIESLETLTSASRTGMLLGLLTAWGGLFGTRTTYHGDQPSVIFSVLIGETGRARKGTTTAAVWTALTNALTSGFVAIPISASRWDGLASGEALVRILSEAKGSDVNKPVYGLVVEEEFERLLRRMKSSEGYQSTLDTYLRQAFDARMIQHLTASKSVRVAPPYGLSILGNVTRETLRHNVTPEMARSGFANRFLWAPIRERQVDITGSTPWHFADGIATSLRAAREAWTGGQHLDIEPPALDLLNEYGGHLRELVGLAGSMGARLHVIAARLALVHATLERGTQIGLEMVDRAIALTEYVRSGLRWSFRDDIGDEDANALYSAVVGRFPDGLWTREARAVVGRSGRFLAARDLLLEHGLITVHQPSTNPDQPSTNRPQTSEGRRGGRPPVSLVAVDPQTFKPFVSSRARTRDGVEEESFSSSLSTNPPHTYTNRPLTVQQPSQTSTVSETSETVDIDPLAPEHVECFFYADHQTKHRREGNRWICDICRKDPA